MTSHYEVHNTVKSYEITGIKTNIERWRRERTIDCYKISIVFSFPEMGEVVMNEITSNDL